MSSKTQSTPQLTTPWYSTTAVSPDLVRITEPHVHPTLQANIWWIRGESDIVVDSGLGVVSLRSTIPALFDNEPQLVITHAHLDHSGGAHEFSNIAVHEQEAEILAHPTIDSLETSFLYPALGLPHTEETSQHRMLIKPPSAGYQAEDYRLIAAKPNRRLTHGDVITTGSHHLEVIAAPGHSPGSICLLDHDNKRLFTGDVVYEGNLLDQTIGACREDYITTMRHLLALDFDVALPGHGDVITRSRFVSIATAYLSLHAA